MKELFLLILSFNSLAQDTIKLNPNLAYKVICKGKLLISAAGNDKIIEREALPSDSGCGIILRPLTNQGETNLWVETSTGSYELKIEISSKAGRTTEITLGEKK